MAAVAGLGYDLRNCEAWLFDLSGPPGEVRTALTAGAVGLCDQHASEITVPVGWELTDERATELDLGPRTDGPVTSANETSGAEPVTAAEPARTASANLTGGSTPLLERAFRVGQTTASQ